MSEKKTMTIHTRDVDVDRWQVFKMLCLEEGISAAEKVRRLINDFVDTDARTLVRLESVRHIRLTQEIRRKQGEEVAMSYHKKYIQEKRNEH